MEELLALPWLHVDEQVELRALGAQRQLARAGHHRLPRVDLMVAAVADRHGVGVLHYDADFDILAERTDLQFESTWLAPRGSL
jgi:predicted nucleic acid-binding protein